MTLYSVARVEAQMVQYDACRVQYDVYNGTAYAMARAHVN